MNIVYYCRHCRVYLGQLDSAQGAPEALGFSVLTDEEQADIIQYDAVNDTTYVRTVCEHCETALRRQPELLLSQTPLQ